ncbi:TonB-dependent receptor [Duganella sp. FT27W]|uniref:TonB-dependent receptor n=1 Tax=Duganella sp. FT27W TaxID=2654636 RepID=UPI001D044CC6|nr:TonB-dependent receptor [Duganella sp. FT27W]
MNHYRQQRSVLRTLPHAVLVSCTMAGTAFAAGSEANGEAEAPALQVVEIRGDKNEDERAAASSSARALPTSVIAVTPDDIAGTNIGRDISNVFRRVPGVVANNIDQGDTGNGFRMRGFATQGTHGADTAVYVDGVPQNIPSSQGGAGHGPVFLEWMTPDMIGNIDVVKGPISALYGDQNRAGAVEITTRDGGAGTPSSLAVTRESYNGRRGSLTVAGEANGVRSLVVADIYRTDGYRNDAHNRRNNLFWKLSTTIGDGDYSLRASYYDSRFTAAGYLLMPAMEAGLSPRSVQFNLPGFGDAERSTVVFNRKPASGEAGWYATVYAEKFERSRAITTSTTQHTFGYDDRNIHGGRLAYQWQFGSKGVLIVGAETRADQGDALRRQYRNGVPTANYINDQNLDLLTYGGFAQGQYRLAPTLKLHGGMRYDHFDYTLRNLKLPAASTDYSASVFTPKYGVLWNALDQLEVFANIAEGFRSPAAEQISSSGSLGPPGATGGRANTGIKPSKVRSYDLGINLKPSPAWQLSATGYYIQNDDEIINSAPDVYTAAGQTTRRGFDLDARYTPGNGYSAYASYGRILRARIDNPTPGTAALLSVPAHQFKAGMEYRLPLAAGKLRLNGDAYVTARNPYYMGSPSVQRDMPTYVRYDLKATWDDGSVQASVFATVQPHEFASDIAYGTTAGLLVSTVPKRQLGASLRYFF